MTFHAVEVGARRQQRLGLEDSSDVISRDMVLLVEHVTQSVEEQKHDLLIWIS